MIREIVAFFDNTSGYIGQCQNSQGLIFAVDEEEGFMTSFKVGVDKGQGRDGTIVADGCFADAC